MLYQKRKIAILMLVILTVTLIFSGCKTPEQEESAEVDDYIEGAAAPEASGDLPEKVEASEVVAEAPENTVTDDPEPAEPEQEQPADSQEPESSEKPEETPAEDDSAEITYKEENFLKILDYNIRCADDGEGKMIADRAPRFKKLVEKYQPDLMGLQEASPKWIDYLSQNLVGSTYSMKYQYRAEDSKEAQPILWNKNKFEVLDDGYFWLSDTPEVASKGWGSDHYRGCTWIKFKVKATGEIFIFMNTHLTGTNTASTNSANLITKRAAAMGGFDDHAVFLTGDFNLPPHSVGYITLTSAFVDVNDALGFNSAYTNNGYNDREDKHKDNWIKDYVMCSEAHVLPLKYSVLNENIDGGWISDHRGLYVEAALY
ncbi:MAG: endonuclease/exonuclease/phosphatase family protein [Clostridia bacterium]|nr:endonuclease/exonuclease/phosphatase family protein [Clostridia bacterium]